MRSIICVLCSIMIMPGILPAAQLHLEVPQGPAEVYLLSSGTSAVLEHLNDQFNNTIDQLGQKHRIDFLRQQAQSAAELTKQQEQAYSSTLQSIRKQYLNSISLSVISSKSEIFPASSALGEVSFYYTVKNNSDHIISDITYKPEIGGITLPTTSALILDLIHPVTLKSGLGPNETLSNNGYEPEHFSFFIGELSKDELKKIEAELQKTFTIDIADIHFIKNKGYKGQTKIMGFSEAFSDRLRPLGSAIEKARADEAAKMATYTMADEQYTREKDTEKVRYTSDLHDLKKTAVRSLQRVDEKNRCTFENIPAGTYIVYAPNTQHRAIFEHITIEDTTNRLMINTMVKDPFEP